MTTAIEHHSVSGACAALGVPVRTLPVDHAGRVDPAALDEALARRPRLVSLQYANNEVGTIQDVPALAARCAAQGVPLHVDAVQAAGQIELLLDNIALLTAAAHKFGGPQGIGFLYARQPASCARCLAAATSKGGCAPAPNRWP